MIYSPIHKRSQWQWQVLYNCIAGVLWESFMGKVMGFLIVQSWTYRSSRYWWERASSGIRLEFPSGFCLSLAPAMLWLNNYAFESRVTHFAFVCVCVGTTSSWKKRKYSSLKVQLLATQRVTERWWRMCLALSFSVTVKAILHKSLFPKNKSILCSAWG